MSIEKKEIEYAKEIGDVLVLVKEIVKTIKEKKDYTALLPALISAVDGATDIDEEVKENKSAVAGTVSYHLGEIAGLFL